MKIKLLICLFEDPDVMCVFINAFTLVTLQISLQCQALEYRALIIENALKVTHLYKNKPWI